jgi:putative phosphoesterase
VRLAVLADVHANVEALRAVLTDLDARGGADQLLVAGDVALLGPDPQEVIELLMVREAVAVYGNVDHFLLETDWHAFEPEDEEGEADRALCLWALAQLSEDAEAWLRGLPFRREMDVDGQRLLMVHGSPRSVVDPIAVDTAEVELREMTTDTNADLILCGHTHESLDRTVGTIRLINPGAVGVPQGTPGTARYALLTWQGEEWQAEFRLVRYDVERTIARLLAAQRPYRLWIAETLRQAGRVPLTTFE